MIPGTYKNIFWATAVGASMVAGCSSESEVGDFGGTDPATTDAPDASDEAETTDNEETDPEKTGPDFSALSSCGSSPKLSIDKIYGTHDVAYTVGTLPKTTETFSVTFGKDTEALPIGPAEDTVTRRFIVKADAEGEVKRRTLFSFENVAQDDRSGQGAFFTVGDALYFTAYLEDPKSTISFGDDKCNLSCSDGACNYLVKLGDEGDCAWVRKQTATPRWETTDGLLSLFSINADSTFESDDASVGVDSDAFLSDNFAVVKYDEDGRVVFVRQLALDGGIVSAALPDGSLALYGTYRGQVVLGNANDAPTELISYADDTDTGFLARYDADGNLVFAKNTFSNADRRMWTGLFISSADTLFASVNVGSSTHIEDGDLFWEASSVSAAIVERGIAAYSMDGALKSAAMMSGERCKLLTARLQEQEIDIVEKCETGSFSNMVQLTARQFDNTGTEVLLQELGGMTIPVDNAPSISLNDDSGRVILSVSDHGNLVWMNGDTANAEPANLPFDTSIAIYDGDYRQTAIHRAKTVQSTTVDNGALYIHAVNSQGFVHIDDFASVGNESYVAKYASDDSLDWISATGSNDSMAQYTADKILFTTSIVLDAAVVGRGDTAKSLSPSPNAQTLYLGSLDKASGDLLFAKPIVTLFSAKNDECAYHVPTQCTDEVLSLAAVEPLRNPPSPSQFNRDAWREAVQWVDPSCIELCDDDEECTIKASCALENGATIELSFWDEIDMDDWRCGYTAGRTKHLDVHLKDGIDDWTNLSLSDEWWYYSGDMESGGGGTGGGFSIQWTGTLFDSWAQDGFLEFGNTGYFRDDTGSSSSSADIAFSFGDCAVSWDEAGQYGESYLEAVTLNGNVYKMCGSNGYINGECLGEIDPDTWEIIGECVEDSCFE